MFKWYSVFQFVPMLSVLSLGTINQSLVLFSLFSPSGVYVFWPYPEPSPAALILPNAAQVTVSLLSDKCILLSHGQLGVHQTV